MDLKKVMYPFVPNRVAYYQISRADNELYMIGYERSTPTNSVIYVCMSCMYMYKYIQYMLVFLSASLCHLKLPSI